MQKDNDQKEIQVWQLFLDSEHFESENSVLIETLSELEDENTKHCPCGGAISSDGECEFGHDELEIARMAGYYSGI